MWNLSIRSKSKNIRRQEVIVSSSVMWISSNLKSCSSKCAADGTLTFWNSNIVKIMGWWRWRIILTRNRTASSRLADAWYDRTSNVTLCFAMAVIAFSYMCVLWMPMPQNIAKASTKFSSFFENGRSLNLFINWKML